jgi:hypothetical protein
MSNGPHSLRITDIDRSLLNEEETIVLERLLEEGVITPDNVDHFLMDPQPYFKSEGFMVKVDFGVPFGLQVMSGHYRHIDQRITASHFPPSGNGAMNCRLRLIKPHFTATTREVLAEIRERGLIPARIEHLLAFGARFAEKQRQFAVAALGSGWEGFIPLLSMHGDPPARSLEALHESSIWDPECRFLVVEVQKLYGGLP